MLIDWNLPAKIHSPVSYLRVSMKCCSAYTICTLSHQRSSESWQMLWVIWRRYLSFLKVGMHPFAPKAVDGFHTSVKHCSESLITGAYVAHLTTLSNDTLINSTDRARLKGYLLKLQEGKILIGCSESPITTEQSSAGRETGGCAGSAEYPQGKEVPEVSDWTWPTTMANSQTCSQ